MFVKIETLVFIDVQNISIFSVIFGTALSFLVIADFFPFTFSFKYSLLHASTKFVTKR